MFENLHSNIMVKKMSIQYPANNLRLFGKTADRQKTDQDKISGV